MENFTEIGKINNSFLKESAAGQKVLVIVPHEDDEMNLAGSMIYTYVQKGAEVYCAFTTNGDYSFAASTRLYEAEQSLQKLGVTKIFFLGYGDTANHYPGGHLFYHENEIVTSPAGHQETYGSLHSPDFSFQIRKSHSPYCRAAMRHDLESLILFLKADIIFCIDLDVHADHRAASIIFEEAMGNILTRGGNTYQPTVFKGFAYCTSFGAPKDFYTRNIYSVPLPPKADDSIIGLSLYDWKSRVRFPVLPKCRGHFLHDNILYQALFKHASQSAALHAVRIVNGDTVFWKRRTDNLIYQANVTASSGNPYDLKEFKILDLKNIDESNVSIIDHSWCPSIDDSKKEIYISWPNKQNISLVKIAGSIKSDGCIKRIIISFDNGSIYELGALPMHGRIISIKLPEIQQVSTACVRLEDVEGSRYGLSFIGFFAHEYEMSVINPYIKLLINDDFAYDYLITNTVNACQLSVYQYNTKEKIHIYSLDDMDGWVDSDYVAHFTSNADRLCIRAEIEGNPDCYDEICIHRLSWRALQKLRLCQCIENRLLTFFLKKHRKYTHIRHKYLKKL